MIVRVMLVWTGVPPYRVRALQKLAAVQGIELTVLSAGGGEQLGATSSVSRVRGFTLRAIPSTTWRLGRVLLVHFPTLRKEIRALEPDVIISEPRMGLLTVMGLVIWPARVGGKRIPVVWWMSGWKNRDRPRSIQMLSEAAGRLLIRRGAGAICYSSLAVSTALAAGVPAQRVCRAQNSVDTSSISAWATRFRAERAESALRVIENDGLRLLYIGRLVERKHVDWLLEAASVVARSGVVIRLRIAGDGPARDSLVDLARCLGLGDKVAWLGRVDSPSEIATHASWADVGVLPAAGGLSINTLMAAGLPVLCGDADGTEEDLVHEGRTGFRTRGPGPQALADALLELAAVDQQALRECGSRAATLIEREASLDNMVSQVADAAFRAAAERW